MVRELTQLGRRRYIGNSESMVVHDRWHPDCQGCGLMDIVRDGRAVGFEPDTLEAAFWEGYEYCEACHDADEPNAPGWARSKSPESQPEPESRSRSADALARRGEPYAPRHQMLAAESKSVETKR